jgi:Microsomal signal peptidase 25 kDa subunit (SPC25)
LTLQSSVKKHVPVYRLKVRYEAPSGKKWEDKEIEGRFAEWFNDAGYLQHSQLKSWLANNIEVIALADRQSKKGLEVRSPDDPLQPAIEARTSGLETPSGAKSTRKGKKKV